MNLAPRPRRYLACGGMDLLGVKSWNDRFVGIGRIEAFNGLLARVRAAFRKGVTRRSGMKLKERLMLKSKRRSACISCERSSSLSCEISSATLLLSLSNAARLALSSARRLRR